jgi:hypothetical protein
MGRASAIPDPDPARADFEACFSPAGGAKAAGVDRATGSLDLET